MLTIAQITDLHISTGADPDSQHRNDTRLRQVLRAIDRLRPRPAAIIASGDLADTGTPEEYGRLAEALATIDIPIYLAMGNHDRRAPLRATFPVMSRGGDAEDFIQYVVELDGLRIVICDTVEEGRDEGAFCETRAAWLADTLDAAPDRPTIIVLHHPPIACGIQWMDPAPDAGWIQRLAAVLEGRKQVLTTICGHVHRPMHALFAGHRLSTSSATALQLTLDLTPVNKSVADGREILIGEPPGFTLLAWDGGVLTTHNCVAGSFPHAITYDVPFNPG